MLFNKGLIATKRPKVAAYINGQSDNRDAAILELAQEFASVGVPYDMTVGGKKLKKGDSYYSGVGGNKAHNPPEQVGAALDADRAKASKVVPATTPPATGEKVDKLSADSKQMKAEEADRSSANKVTNNVTVAQNNQTITQKPKVVDDRSIYERTQHG
jgi:hypothetical protein